MSPDISGSMTSRITRDIFSTVKDLKGLRCVFRGKDGEALLLKERLYHLKDLHLVVDRQARFWRFASYYEIALVFDRISDVFKRDLFCIIYDRDSFVVQADIA
jgi:hypothetical protein